MATDAEIIEYLAMLTKIREAARTLFGVRLSNPQTQAFMAIAKLPGHQVQRLSPEVDRLDPRSTKILAEQHRMIRPGNGDNGDWPWQLTTVGATIALAVREQAAT